MEVVNGYAGGLDVHKASVVACALYGDLQGKVVREVATFGTMTADLISLRDWLVERQVRIVAMESTGVYWKPVYTILVEALEVMVVNAAHMKAIPGRKTDVKDAEWIADLLRHGLLKGSFIPSEAQRDVRELTRLRSSVVAERGRAVNRLQKLLEQANLKLATVASEVTGVSARAMLNQIVAGNTTVQALAALAQGRLKDKTDVLERALDGRVRSVHRFLMADALAQIDYYDERLERLSQEIDQRLRPFDEALVRLDTIPGVGRIVAQTVLAEVGTDMSRFPDQQHLTAWAGLVPANKVSGGKRLSASIRKGSPALKRTLVQAAHAAIHTKTYLSAFYRRIAARRGKKRAIISVARKILEIAYFILRDGTTYHDLGPDYFDRRNRQRTIQRLTNRLERLGLNVTLDEVTPQSSPLA